MSTEGNFDIVAKFGGSSMASPETVQHQLDLHGNNADIVVVSAPGVDYLHPRKTTDLLLDYRRSPNPGTLGLIQHRFADIVEAASETPVLSQILEEIPSEISTWQQQGDPVEALGEYWSAKLFAAYSDRTFFDAKELIIFDESGVLDIDKTCQVVRSQLKRGKKYVVPGFYGADRQGTIRVLERGGSDITGAVIALALNANEYHNWSDVDGFMSADPNKIDGNIKLVPEVTYREARELANTGSELLHRSAIKLLGHTGIKTLVRNTFSEPGSEFTTIVRERDRQRNPVIGVTGHPNFLELTIHEFGLNEEVGITADVYDELNRHLVPYEHTATATDDVAIFLLDEYSNAVNEIVEKLQGSKRKLSLQPAGLVHVVGEGLAKSAIARFKIIGEVATAFAEAEIEGLGLTDVAGSAALTFFVNPRETFRAVKIAHDTLNLGN